MESDKETTDVEHWKRKYFDQLEDAERAEKQWQAADELLRKTISRLTLAADGQDATLDKQLRDLRNAIRDRAGVSQLQRAIEAMSDTLVRLDRERKQARNHVDDDPLLKLLDTLSLPKGTGRAVKALRKRLEAGEQAQAVEAFAELLHSALELAPDREPDTAEAAAKGGLLRRLFGGEDKAAPDADSSGAQADQHDVSVREILIRLLERLSLPDELNDRLQAVRDQIDSAARSETWNSVIEQIAELVQAIRSQTQKEKQGIENFLLQITERLQEVDKQLAGSEQYYDESLAAGEHLDSALKQGMSSIRDDMREATDLEQIKQRVETHIDTVLAHMLKHRETEQARYDKAKAEIAAMNERLHSMEDEADALRTRLHDERSQAQTDALTGIPNRLAYEERLEQEVARWKRFGTPLVLLIWDIDYFKKVNDTFGHKAGDKVLRTIAGTLSKAIRETDFIARYGGEEFVQLMTGSDIEDCLPVAEKLRTLVAESGFHFRGESVTITASCGLAQLRDGDSMEQWFERADSALYKAKRSGRNRCEPAGED